MNIIQKLNSIKVEDLKKLDREQIKEAILQKPEISINILLIAITLYVTIFTYNSGKVKSASLKKEASELKEKLKVVKESTALNEEYALFIKNFKKTINIEQLSNKLSEFAVHNNVQILFFTPGVKGKTAFAEETNIKLRITSKNYANIIYFIKEIEDSPFNIRVNRWQGEYIKYYGQGESNKKQTLIEANVELSLFTLQNA